MMINLTDEEIRLIAIACKEHAVVIKVCRELDLGNYTDQSTEKLEDLSEHLLKTLNDAH